MIDKKVKYNDYFKNHYGATGHLGDTLTQMSFLYNQFKYIDKKIDVKKYENKNILEVGSGLGALAKYLLDYGCLNYTGIDLDKKIVKYTNDNIGNHFSNVALEEMPVVKGNKFNLIFALEVLEHLDNPYTEINTLFKLLSTKGTLIATSPYPFRKNVLADQTHKYCLHPENWKKILVDAGFSRVEIIPMSYFPFLWRINKYLNIRIPFYVPFKNFISTTLIIARK